MSSPERNYYCSLKFRYLKIDMESNTTYNCHAARPHAVDFAWLDRNPGQLFNTNFNVSERQMMLENVRNASCEQNCWHAEDRGAISPRLYQGGVEKTHVECRTTPEIIDITVGSDCNLTCSYCCKEFSSAWRNDINKNGAYEIGQDSERYSLSNRDKMLIKISQPELKRSSKYNRLLDEIKMMAPGVKKLDITGGEPLLDNSLIDTLVGLPLSDDCSINIYTGLGVNINRFRKLCQSLAPISNVKFKISAENIGKNLQFNRYGIHWAEFAEKIEVIRQHGIKFNFHCTITNLTAFGFRDFYDWFSDEDITMTFAYRPRMMAAYVMDDESKDLLRKQFSTLPEEYRTKLNDSMKNAPTEQDRQDLQKFLTEFVARRPDLDLTIFPSTFLKWVGSNVV